MRILGLDYGTKRIGVAISDELLLTAQGMDTIQRRDITRDMKAIRDLAAEYAITEIIVGLPLSMDGSYSQKTKEVVKFIEDLSKEVAVPVKTYDERLTSWEADQIMLEANLSRQKRRSLSDRIAAQLILQGYLDNRKKG